MLPSCTDCIRQRVNRVLVQTGEVSGHLYCLFPSSLKDAWCPVSRSSVREAVPPVFYEHPLLKPYNIFDVSQGREQRGGSNGGSLRNQACTFDLLMWHKLVRKSVRDTNSGHHDCSDKHTRVGPHMEGPATNPLITLNPHVCCLQMPMINLIKSHFDQFRAILESHRNPASLCVFLPSL